MAESRNPSRDSDETTRTGAALAPTQTRSIRLKFSIPPQGAASLLPHLTTPHPASSCCITNYSTTLALISTIINTTMAFNSSPASSVSQPHGNRVSISPGNALHDISPFGYNHSCSPSNRNANKRDASSLDHSQSTIKRLDKMRSCHWNLQ